jgi:hypothetical protein
MVQWCASDLTGKREGPGLVSQSHGTFIPGETFREGATDSPGSASSALFVLKGSLLSVGSPCLHYSLSQLHLQ